MIAYRDLYDGISETAGLSFFSVKAQEYDIKINGIRIDKEKQSLQEKLKTENGEVFGNKLYEYIYAPILESKHKLLDAVTLGNISAKAAEDELKTKLIPMPDKEYDVCIQSDRADVKNDFLGIEHYCSHNADQSIHHITVNGDIIQINEIL